MMLYCSARATVRLSLVASLTLGLALPATEAIAQFTSTAWISWSDIFSSDPPVPAEGGGSRGSLQERRIEPPVPTDPGGSRGDSPSAIATDLCLIAPLTSVANLEVTQTTISGPTLVWKGDVETVELRLQGAQSPLWQTTGEQGHAIYNGTPSIAPGQIYQWLIYSPETDQPPVEVPFVTLTSAQQAQINEELDALAAAGGSSEEKARRRADYFAAKGFWSDFWREVLLVENPSAELVTLISEAPEVLCPN